MFVSFSDDGLVYLELKIVIEFGCWLWWVMWYGDLLYGVFYGILDCLSVIVLYVICDGINYEIIMELLFEDGEFLIEVCIWFGGDG